MTVAGSNLKYIAYIQRRKALKAAAVMSGSDTTVSPVDCWLMLLGYCSNHDGSRRHYLRQLLTTSFPRCHNVAQHTNSPFSTKWSLVLAGALPPPPPSLLLLLDVPFPKKMARNTGERNERSALFARTMPNVG